MHNSEKFCGSSALQMGLALGTKRHSALEILRVLVTVGKKEKRGRKGARDQRRMGEREQKTPFWMEMGISYTNSVCLKSLPVVLTPQYLCRYFTHTYTHAYMYLHIKINPYRNCNVIHHTSNIYKAIAPNLASNTLTLNLRSKYIILGITAMSQAGYELRPYPHLWGWGLSLSRG